MAKFKDVQWLPNGDIYYRDGFDRSYKLNGLATVDSHGVPMSPGEEFPFSYKWCNCCATFHLKEQGCLIGFKDLGVVVNPVWAADIVLSKPFAEMRARFFSKAPKFHDSSSYFKTINPRSITEISIDCIMGRGIAYSAERDEVFKWVYIGSDDVFSTRFFDKLIPWFGNPVGAKSKNE